MTQIGEAITAIIVIIIIRFHYMANRFAIFCTFIWFNYLTSCSYSPIPRYIKKEFKYSPSTQKVDQRISYDGVYKELNLNDSINLCSKYYYTFVDSSSKITYGAFDIIFLKNGICSMGYLDWLLKDTLNKRNLTTSSDSYVGGGSYWGYYEINDDTIKIKVIQRNSLMAGSTDSFEEWYKISDDMTILPIYFRSISKSACTEKHGSTFLIDTVQYPAIKFYKIHENLIDPNLNWLINKKWFWKNEKEYYQWKKDHEK